MLPSLLFLFLFGSWSRLLEFPPFLFLICLSTSSFFFFFSSPSSTCVSKGKPENSFKSAQADLTFFFLCGGAADATGADQEELRSQGGGDQARSKYGLGDLRVAQKEGTSQQARGPCGGCG